MTPRGLLTTIGATALGFGVIIGGAAENPAAFAQEATPPAVVAPAQARPGPASDFAAQRAQAYNDFVAALASELGDDEAAVDTAIRTALQQQVDQRQAAGDLDAEQAAAVKAVIEVSDAPLFAGFGGSRGFAGFDDHDERRGPGGHGGFEGRGPHGDASAIGGGSVDRGSPSALPTDEDAADQDTAAPDDGLAF
jgi:hypothetical protein